MIEKWYYKDFETKLSDLKSEPKEIWFMTDRPDDIILISPSMHPKYKKIEVNDSYDILNIERCGGTIVSFKDGIGLFHICKDRRNILKKSRKINEALCEYLISKGLNAKVAKNDVLVDGYKVSGNAISNFNKEKDYYLYGIHIALNVDLEIIKKYCSKPMHKIPKGLSEYGLTKNDILDYLFEVINNIEKEENNI